MSLERQKTFSGLPKFFVTENPDFFLQEFERSLIQVMLIF